MLPTRNKTTLDATLHENTCVYNGTMLKALLRTRGVERGRCISGTIAAQWVLTEMLLGLFVNIPLNHQEVGRVGI